MYNYLAHTKDCKTFTTEDESQKLIDHLANVARYAKRYASCFDASEEAYLIGLLHDIGKYKDSFQQRIRGKINTKVDHSTQGAIEIINIIENLGEYYAMVIAGHHTGLKDANNKHIISGNSFYARINNYEKQNINYSDILTFEKKITPKILQPYERSNIVYCLATYIKMLFSCLVDADWTDTEEFVKGINRKPVEYDIQQLYNNLISKIPKNNGSYINNIRAKILEDCIKKSVKEQGIFSLTVPTGGGKTYSSLAFALNHAKVYNLKRVIFVIPYTSIIEQNAKVISEALGEEFVLEHHNNKTYGEKDIYMKWASENWNIPVILTTNVQFFESFYSNKPSKCRKLHNISQSVVIFDEVQVIPLDYISPCFYAICELVSHYKVTAVLCSATQPNIKNFLYKNMKINEIISSPDILFEKLKRVKYTNIGEKTDKELVKLILKEHQTLIIVNSRKHAYYLYHEVKAERENVYHLSTTMTPYDRSNTIQDMKEDLKEKKEIVVISTQLIEAGVDIDFPTVFRSIAGIDSIVQAAGRANREGLLDLGEVYIFKPNDNYSKIPRSILPYASIAEEVMAVLRERAFDLEGIREYYKKLYFYASDSGVLDKKKILAEFYDYGNNTLKLNFETASQNFKFIENNTQSLIIEMKESKELIKSLRDGNFDYRVTRKLGRFSVNIYDFEIKRLRNINVIELLQSGYYLLNNEKFYSKEIGLEIFNEENLNADCFCI